MIWGLAVLESLLHLIPNFYMGPKKAYKRKTNGYSSFKRLCQTSNRAAGTLGRNSELSKNAQRGVQTF